MLALEKKTIEKRLKVVDMGTNYYIVKKKPTIAAPLHIGKSSCGWKFLFHEVNKRDCEFDENLEIHTYEQWVEFLKDNDEIVILNEYDEIVSLDYLLELIKEKQSEENDENFAYCKNVNGYRFSDREFS